MVLLKINDDGALHCRIVIDNKNVTGVFGRIAQSVAFQRRWLLVTPSAIAIKEVYAIWIYSEMTMGRCSRYHLTSLPRVQLQPGNALTERQCRLLKDALGAAAQVSRRSRGEGTVRQSGTGCCHGCA